MNKSTIVLCAALALFLSACGTQSAVVETAAPVESSGLVAAKAKFSGYTAADFAAGQALYQGNCGRCHGLYGPRSHSEAQWAEVVPRMVVKANKKAQATVISPEGEQLIVRYLFASSN